MDEQEYQPGGGSKSRKELASYLNRIGRGVNCRLDVPVLTLEDIKWAATIFGELSKELADIAFNDPRVEIYRILAARNSMETARLKLATTNGQKLSIKMARDASKSHKF